MFEKLCCILKNGNLRKSDAPPLTEIRFDKTIFPSKLNKLPQERNSYLISFPKYSSGSFKIEHPVHTHTHTHTHTRIYNRQSIKQIIS